MSLRVLRPGVLTSIQDLGRHGVAHLGVSGAGAADPLSLRLANRLVGNRDNAAALEITLVGPRLVFDVDAVIALVGGRLTAHVDDTPVAMEQTIQIHAGQTLSIGALQTGVRAYMAVAGGIRVPPVLGSRATDTLAGLGPEIVDAGRRLPIRTSQLRHRRYLRKPLPLDPDEPLRVIPGPHADWFTPAANQTLLQQPYAVDATSDRTGVRLRGPALARAKQGELDSEGMVTGALQVPPSGQPIVLIANHGPTGGYPTIATVIAADLWRLAQGRPGQCFRFQTISPAAARRLLAQQEHYLDSAIVGADQTLLDVRELLWLSAGNTLDEIEMTFAGGHIRLRR